MRISGSATVAAPLTTVWAALQDPAVLARTIPGCLRLEAVGEDAYEMTVTAGIASIKGTYVGRVELTDPEPYRSFVLRARGQGAPGTVDATVRVSLSDSAAGGQADRVGTPGPVDMAGVTGRPAEGTGTETAIGYDAEAVVGGMIGGVGQRMLATVARRTAAEFFGAVEQALIMPAQQETQAVQEAAPAPDVATAREAAEETMETMRRPPVGAVFPGVAGGRVPSGAGARAGAGAGAGAGASGGQLLAAFGAGGSVALAGVAIGFALARRAARPTRRS